VSRVGFRKQPRPGRDHWSRSPARFSQFRPISVSSPRSHVSGFRHDARQIKPNDALHSQIPPEIKVDRSFLRPRPLRRSRQRSPAAPTQRRKQYTARPFRSADTTNQAETPQQRRPVTNVIYCSLDLSYRSKYFILHSVLSLHHFWGKGGKPIYRGNKFLSRALSTASYTVSRNRVVTKYTFSNLFILPA